MADNLGRLFKDITDFIFVKNERKRADVILIPGSSCAALPEEAGRLWLAGEAPWIVPSGKASIVTGVLEQEQIHSEGYDGDYRTECEFYTAVLLGMGVAAEAILGEDRAQYTAQNAQFTRELLEEKGIIPDRALLVCKNYHARRCLMYYQMAFPETELLVWPVEYEEDGIRVAEDDWYQTETGRRLVLGELERIGVQFVKELQELALWD